nr:hypothetical protein [uncultured Arsenicibacter sp.]
MIDRQFESRMAKHPPAPERNNVFDLDQIAVPARETVDYKGDLPSYPEYWARELVTLYVTQSCTIRARHMEVEYEQGDEFDTYDFGHVNLIKLLLLGIVSITKPKL